MAKRFIFRKIRGKIRRIKVDQLATDIASASAVFIGGSILTEKARKKTIGSAGAIGNLGIGLGGTAIISFTAAKKFRPVMRGFQFFNRIIRGK